MPGGMTRFHKKECRMEEKLTKRLIFAVTLSVLVVSISSYLQRRIYRKPVLQKTVEEQTKKSTEAISSPVLMPAHSLPGELKSGEEIKISSKLYEVSFSPEGAIKHWRLKAYKEKDGSLVDLVPGQKPTGDYNYEVFPLKNEKGVVLRTVTEGAEIKKEFSFDEGENYQISIRFWIKNNSSQEKDISIFKWGPGIEGNINPRELIITSWAKNGGARKKVHKVKETISQDPDVQWTGLGGKYFAIALIPANIGSCQATGYAQQRLVILKESEGVSIQSIVEKVPPGAKIEGKLLVYAGPKDGEILKSAGNNLHALINYGSIGNIIFSLLKWFYHITRNYGVAIILLSGLIKIVLFPLTRVSLKSMKGMQKIQPQIAMLRQRFKHDPQALNRETMELYKRMKINPMGGCLPMIFQLPIFFALFTVLRDAIELRHSPFIFWIRDLSSKDPYYVLPILMGVTTFIQQKMTATDQQQKPMMTYFMTIFLTVIFLNFPAGLVLYWLITNILSIGEQKLIAKIS